MKINVYDFDGTIYDGDSSVDFYLFCIKKRKKILCRIPSFCFTILLYLLKKRSKEELKENYFSFLNDFDNIDKLIDDFWINHSKKIKQFFLEKDHSNDIIISASPYFLLNPICTELGIKDLIATDVDKNTGKFLGLNCYGEEKVNRLRNKYKKVIIDEFYTDSLSDMPLIKISNVSYIVKKDQITPCKSDGRE